MILVILFIKFIIQIKIVILFIIIKLIWMYIYHYINILSVIYNNIILVNFPLILLIIKVF